MFKTKNKIPVDLKPVVLIMGDGACLSDDLKDYYSFLEPADVFAVNKSINFYGRCKHWGTADGEEAIHQAIQLKLQHPKLICHTLEPEIQGFDVFWKPDNMDAINWRGSSALFAAEACLGMGYKKIVLAGVPMDNNGHWYDPFVKGPLWTEEAYMKWEMFAKSDPPVKSMSGWTNKLFGRPTKKWLKKD